jgi:hypothetical protein
MQIRLSSLLFFIMTPALFIYSCRKNKPDIKHEVIGIWELIKSSSGKNKIVKTFPPGNGIHLFFDSTRYRQSYNGNMTSMGHYRITRDAMINGEISDRIFFKAEVYAEDTTRFFINIKDSQLVVTEDFADGVTRFYQRLK